MRPNKIGWGIVALFGVGGAIFVIFVREAWLLGTIWMAVAGFLALLYIWMGRRADEADRLKREGIQGQATILELTQTGTYINENPRVKLRMQLEGPGVEPHEVTHTYTVPLVAMGAFATGDTLPVYFDRKDVSKFTIDWLGGRSDGAGKGDPHERLEKLEELKQDGLITPAEYDERRKKILDSI